MATTLTTLLSVLLVMVVLSPTVIIYLQQYRVRRRKLRTKESYRSFFEQLEAYEARPEPETLDWVPLSLFSPHAFFHSVEDLFLRDIKGQKVRVVEANISVYRGTGDNRSRHTLFEGWMAKLIVPRLSESDGFRLFTGRSLHRQFKLIVTVYAWTFVGLLLFFAVPMIWQQQFAWSDWWPLLTVFAILGAAILLAVAIGKARLGDAEAQEQRLHRLAEQVGPGAAKAFEDQELKFVSDEAFGVRCLAWLRKIQSECDMPKTKIGAVIRGPDVLLLIHTKHDLFYTSHPAQLRRRLDDDLARIDRLVSLAADGP